MASESWPASLPQDAFVSLNVKKQDGRIRTQMDAGPPKMRRKYTAVREIVNHSMIMDGADKKTLDNFWENNLNGGVERFDWSDPTTDNTVEFRFVEPYGAKLLSGGDSDSRQWEISMTLEIMP